MNTLRRLIAVGLLGVVAVGAGAFATGSLTHVATTGVSMEPTYSAGDLVVVGRGAPYKMGDIVAYRAPGDDTLVLHRIIGGDETGFTIQGDNNESIDPYRPTANEILGRELIHVPRVGALLTSPLSRGALLFPVLALLGVMTMKKAETTVKANGAPATRRRLGMARVTWCLMLALDVVLLIAVGAAHLLASGGESDAPDRTAQTQTVDLSYHAEADASEAYPNGELTTGDPVFRTLVDRVEVVFRHTTDAKGAVAGSASLDVELSTPSGWSRTSELVRPTTFESNGAELSGTLVLSQISALVGRVAEETGVPAHTITVTVTASGEASLDGADAEPFTVEMAMQLDGTSLALTSETVDSDEGPVVAATSPLSQAEEAEEPEAAPRDLRTPLLVALLAAVALTVVLWPSSNDDETTDVAMTGAVTVRLPNTTARIQVADRESLEAIAAKVARPVLTAVGWEGVLTAEALYWHETTEHRTDSAEAMSVAPTSEGDAEHREFVVAIHQ